MAFEGRKYTCVGRVYVRTCMCVERDDVSKMMRESEFRNMLGHFDEDKNFPEFVFQEKYIWVFCFAKE